MTQPKEIYLNNEWQHSFGCKISKKFASDEQLEETQAKYLSEEHFNSLIEEKERQIKSLKTSLEEKDKELEKALKHIRLLLATMDGELEANREEYGESYAEHLTSINAKEYLDNYKTR